MQDPRGSVQALRQSSILHLVVQVVVSILQSSMHCCRSRLVSDAADGVAISSTPHAIFLTATEDGPFLVASIDTPRFCGRRRDRTRMFAWSVSGSASDLAVHILLSSCRRGRSGPGRGRLPRRSRKSPPSRASPAPQCADNPAPARPRSFADRAASRVSKVFARSTPTASDKAVVDRPSVLPNFLWIRARTACARPQRERQLHLIRHLIADPCTRRGSRAVSIS
jgi:hypothetical protein